MRRKHRNRGSFFVSFIFFSFFLCVAVGLVGGATYIYRDQLILEFIANGGGRVLGLHDLSLGSIKTYPVGSVSFELGSLGVQASADSPAVRVQKLTVSIPKNAVELYALVKSGGILPIKIQIVGLSINVASKKVDDGPPPAVEDGTGDSIGGIIPAALLHMPVGVEIDAEIRDSTATVGSAAQAKRLTGITGLFKISALELYRGDASFETSGQVAMAASGLLGTGIPLRADWKIKGTAPDLENMTIEIKESSISLFGVNVKGTGQLQLPKQDFSFTASGASTDIGVLPVDSAESQALGLTGRLSGSAEISIDAKGNLKNSVSASGAVRLHNAVLPLELKRQTPRPLTVVGPVSLDIEAPYELQYSFREAKLKSIDLALATVRTDLTRCEVRSSGVLNKPAGVPLTLNAQATSQGDNIDLGPVQVQFSNLALSARGRISIAPGQNSAIGLALTLPDLNGWPQLLPALGKLDSGPLVRSEIVNRASGAIALKLAVELPLAGPGSPTDDIKAQIQQLDISRFEYPLSFELKDDTTSDKPSLLKRSFVGIVRGSLSAAASANKKGDTLIWSIARADGAFDLRDLAIEWDDLFVKAHGRDLATKFKAKGDAVNIHLDSLDIKAKDVSLKVSGDIKRHSAKSFNLYNKMLLNGALSAFYSLSPKFRAVQAKLPQGTLASNISISGFFDTDQAANSPVVLTGSMAIKAPTLLILDPKGVGSKHEQIDVVDARPGKSQTSPFLRWPMLAKSRITTTLDVGRMNIGPSVLLGLSAKAELRDGSVVGQAKLNDAFGGPLQIFELAVRDIPKQTDASLEMKLRGRFQKLSLSRIGEFVDPKYRSMFAGSTSGTFSAGVFPLSSAPLLDTLKAEGDAGITNGFVSTVRFDDLVNKKLASIPGLGSQASVNSKGATADIKMQFGLVEKSLRLKAFSMVTPEKNALTLTGSVRSDLVAALEGKAFLVNTPVGGSVRAANSDAQGRLVVPIKIEGLLTSPTLTIAEDAVKTMLQKTLEHEGKKLKSNVENEAKKFIDQQKGNAADRLKEELKKRGIGF